MTYRLHLLPAAHDAILEHAQWIARESRSVEIAERWMSGVYGSADVLEQEPRSQPLAEEDEHLGHEVRKLVIGGFTLLFVVDDERSEVIVVGARGRGQLPKR